MITRSKGKIMSANPGPGTVIPQPHSSGLPTKSVRSEHTAQSRSSHSSATVRAQKAAAEALVLRRRLEREQELAAHERDREQVLAERERDREQVLAERERERERELAALQHQVEECELQAELAAIDAVATSAGSRASHRSSTRVSVDRTKKWIENHNLDSCVDRDVTAVGCDQGSPGTPPGHSVHPPMTTRTTAISINPHTRRTQLFRNVTKASEAVGCTAPLISTELDQPATFLQAVADTAAAAKALASAAGVKKLELPQFNGNTLHWLQFKRTYNVTKANFSPLDNINRLDIALRGPAREAVAALLMSTSDPEEVMRALEDNFARPELIVYKEVNSLKNLPRLDLRTCYGDNSATLKEQESTLPELAKEVEDNSRYKTLEANATVLKLLVDDKNGVSRSEVFDMLHSRDDNEKHMDLPTFPEDAEDARAEVPSVPDSQAEFLQAPGEAVRRDSQKARNSSVRGEPIGAAAGIMVLVTCSIVCLAYTALIVWRRIYLKRNGLKHELLRNEENIAETRIEL